MELSAPLCSYSYLVTSLNRQGRAHNFTWIKCTMALRHQPTPCHTHNYLDQIQSQQATSCLESVTSQVVAMFSSKLLTQPPNSHTDQRNQGPKNKTAHPIPTRSFLPLPSMTHLVHHIDKKQPEVAKVCDNKLHASIILERGSRTPVITNCRPL